MKLRICSKGIPELIFYQRENIQGPKISNYSRYKIDYSQPIYNFLTDLFGIRGFVRKKRTVFLVGQTRIHLDDVEGLGVFCELEVVMEPNQSDEYGIEISQKLMLHLGIQQDNLISKSYIDLFEQKNYISASVYQNS